MKKEISHLPSLKGFPHIYLHALLFPSNRICIDSHNPNLKLNLNMLFSKPKKRPNVHRLTLLLHNAREFMGEKK